MANSQQHKVQTIDSIDLSYLSDFQLILQNLIVFLAVLSVGLALF